MSLEDALQILIFIGACLLSAVLTGAILGPLRRANVRQTVREDGPESHLAKTGTPSMGGIAILTTIVVVAVVALLALGELGGRAAPTDSRPDIESSLRFYWLSPWSGISVCTPRSWLCPA